MNNEREFEEELNALIVKYGRRLPKETLVRRVYFALGNILFS